MTTKKMFTCTVATLVCAAMGTTAWASSTTPNPTAATVETSGPAEGMYNEFSMTGKVKDVDIISVVMPSNLIFNIECDKDDGAIKKIQSGVGEIINNSNKNMDLKVIAVKDNGNFLNTVDLYLAEGEKSLAEIKQRPDTKLIPGTGQDKIVTTLARSQNQKIQLYGEPITASGRLDKANYTIDVTMKISVKR